MSKGQIKKLYNYANKNGYLVEESENQTEDNPEIKIYLFVTNNRVYITVSQRTDSNLFILNMYSDNHFDHTFYFKKLSSIIDWLENN